MIPSAAISPDSSISSLLPSIQARKLRLHIGLATLAAVSLGLGSNPGEDMDVCNCIVPSWHGGTLNSRRAASPLVRLVEGEDRWEAPDHPRVSSFKIGVKPS
ncbi:uncharacterized protein TNCV_4616341 [Trichonephila clavipes]|nr:uncharacterized protein TNCV_4616341 [Trichonephila clavipes]